jgi:pimeloyl-ACP methyl ester carboxylesterase
MEPRVDHARVPTNGVDLHVVQAGPESGPLVVLLHGFPELWYGWRRQIEPLAEAGHRVWVPDQRGYNTSDKPKRVRDYRIRELAADIFGLLGAAGVDRAHVVGHDWGAAVAWWMALEQPARIDRMAILNVPHPTVFARTLRSSRRQRRKSRYMLFFQLPWLPERALAARQCARGVHMLRATSSEGAFTDADLARYVEAWQQPRAIQSMLNWYRALRYRDRPSGRRVTVPTLVLWGARDVALCKEMAPASIELCDDGRLEMLDTATHWIQHDEPEWVTERLLEHLGRG